MKPPIINEALFQIADKSFEFAVDIVRIYEGMGDNKEKYPAKQLLRYGTQIGAKVVRSGTDFTRSGFIKCFAVACRRAEQTKFWLDAVNNLGYLRKEDYQEYKSRIEGLNTRMDSFHKKIRLNKAIKMLGTSRIVSDGRLLKYNYN